MSRLHSVAFLDVGFLVSPKAVPYSLPPTYYCCTQSLNKGQHRVRKR